ATASAQGCKSKDAVPGLTKADDARWANIPVPPADGPKLVALKASVAIVDKPEGKAIGELGAGSVVARSLESYSKSECAGGWYAVRPRGFVCATKGAVALDATMAKLAAPPPDLTRALPYRYGRARTENVILYSRLPSSDEQASLEPDL